MAPMTWEEKTAQLVRALISATSDGRVIWRRKTSGAFGYEFHGKAATVSVVRRSAGCQLVIRKEKFLGHAEVATPPGIDQLFQLAASQRRRAEEAVDELLGVLS